MIRFAKQIFYGFKYRATEYSEVCLWGVRFLALVGLVLLAGCAADSSAGSSTLAPNSPTLLFGDEVLGAGESVLHDLPTTAPDDVDEFALMFLDITFEDELTGKPLAGSVGLAHDATGELETLDEAGGSVVCEQQVACVVAIQPTGDDGGHWLVELSAEGYVTQKFALRMTVLSNKRMTMPVKLRPLGDEG
ncbi:MAG: hypothetical protein AAF902_11495 [Chloroflexota bacterium]